MFERLLGVRVARAVEVAATTVDLGLRLPLLMLLMMLLRLVLVLLLLLLLLIFIVAGITFWMLVTGGGNAA